MNIRKKLTYSILALTALLALTAGIVSGLKLSGAQTDALWTKGRSLSAVLAEAVTSSYLSDDLGTTVGSTERSLEFVKGDHGREPGRGGGGRRQATRPPRSSSRRSSAAKPGWMPAPWPGPSARASCSTSRTATW